MLTQNTLEVFRRLGGEPVLLMFSGGKDSIAMLDIAMTAGLKNVTVVHCYYAADIPSREKLLTYYEAKYGIKIVRRLGWYGASILNGKTVKQSEIYNGLRKEFDISYVAEGIKPTDSIIRCTLIKRSDNGIDSKMLTVYPMHRWYDSAVMAYIRQHKLLLPPEYQANVKHDLSNPTLDSLVWMKRNLPGDYEAIIKAYPQLKERLIHKELYSE